MALKGVFAIGKGEGDKGRDRKEEIRELQQHLQDLYEEKKEMDGEMLLLSRFIDQLVVEDARMRTKDQEEQ